MSMSAADIYARCLLPLKEGYPLYYPELPRRRNAGLYYETYRRQGIDIGDVGIITSDGDFDFLFNICSRNLSNEHMVPEPNEASVRPAVAIREPGLGGPTNDHNPSGSTIVAPLPTGFVLIDAGEVRVRANYIHPNHPYRSCGMEEHKSFDLAASMNAIVASPLTGGEVGWKFECSSQRGAVVVTPGGATLTEALEEQQFLHSIESINSWFKYAAEKRHRQFKSLILVTGAIKCKSWSVAAISNAECTNSGKVSISLLSAANGTLSASHFWREYRSHMCHSGPDSPSHTENQCVFIRGYRIMRQNIALRVMRKVKTDDLKTGKTHHYNLAKPTDARVDSASDPTPTSQPPIRVSTASGSRPESDLSRHLDDLAIDVGENFVVDKLSETDEPYHPSDIINRYLLSQFPIAEYAITHDRQWWALLEDNALMCLDENELLRRVCESYRVALVSSVIFLEEKSIPGDIVMTSAGGVSDESKQADLLEAPCSVDVMIPVADTKTNNSGAGRPIAAGDYTGSVNSVHVDERSASGYGSCLVDEEETLGDTKLSLPIKPVLEIKSSSSKTPAIDNKLSTGVDGLVKHMVEGAQHAADVDELLETALKSFQVIEQISAEASLSCDTLFVAVANGARRAGRDYLEAVEESVKVTGRGVAFASEFMSISYLLSKDHGPSTRSLIHAMRTIVEQALGEADTTNRKFRDIRKSLIQLIKKIPVQQQNIKEGEPKHNSEEQDYVPPWELIEKALDNIGHLLDGVDKFANWWCQAESLISALDLEIAKLVSNPRISPIRLEMARKGWETVGDRYEAYNRAIDTLADYYPVDNTRTLLDKIVAWFTRS